MSPEANASILRIKADYPDVQWAQDMPNTVILWFDHIKAFVHLVGEEMDPPIELDEARARSALDALLGVTKAEEAPEQAEEASEQAESGEEMDPVTAPPQQGTDPAPADEPPAPEIDPAPDGQPPAEG